MIRLKPGQVILSGLAFFAVSFMIVQSLFHSQTGSLAARIRQKSSEYTALSTLLSEKDAIRSEYSKLGASSRVNGTADWVKYLTEIAERERIDLESIFPKSTARQDQAGEFRYALKFCASPEQFGGFVYALTSKDPFSKIDGIQLSKTNDGILNCELTLSRSMPK